MTAVERAALNAFDIDEPRPWVTFPMLLRYDDLLRREAALRAIKDWPDVPALTLLDAILEQHRLDAEFEEFDRETDAAQGAYVL